MVSKSIPERLRLIHPSAEIEQGSQIGEGTSVWHLCHVRKGSEIGSKCTLGRNVFIDSGVKLGNGVKVQNNVSIYHGVEIENDVFIGPDVVFTNDIYPRAAIWDASRLGRTLVKQGASIGANATIICGDRMIGEYSLIAAGSVVTRNVPAHALVMGNPARITGVVCFCGNILKRIKKNESTLLPLNCEKCGKTVMFHSNGP